MESRRYYRKASGNPNRFLCSRDAACTVLAVVALVLGSRFTAAASSGVTQTAAGADCEELKHDPLPRWADSAESSKRMTDCGYAFTHDGDYARAEVVFAAALDMAKRRADRSSEAVALDGYGLTLGTLGQLDRAEPLLQESFRISEELGDNDGMAEASSQLGHLRNIQARYEEAREYHARSFTLWETIDNQRGMAVALNNVGAMYRAVGDYVAASEYYQRSLDGLERIGDRRRSATVIDNLARNARVLGDYAKGLELSRQALAIREEFKDREGIGRSLTSLSENYRAQGNYTAALESLRRSLDVFNAVGNVHAIAETLNNVAVVYEAQGNYTQAASYLRKSLALNDAKVGSASLSAEIQTHLGEVFFQEGLSSRAIQSLQRSLALSEASELTLQAADARLAIARVYTARGQLTLAAQSLEKVLAFRDATGDRGGRADALIAMAEIERRRGRFATALALATEARGLADAMELVDVQWLAMTAVGRADIALKRPAEARDAFDRAIAIVEDMRSQNGGGEETNSRFFADRLAPYQERIELALAAANTRDAFYFAERSKARVLLDVIRGDHVPITKAMTEDERRREVTLRSDLNSVNSEIQLAARVVPHDETRLDALRHRRDARRLAYEDFQSGLYVSHPRLRINRAAVPPIRAAEAQQLVSDPAAAILEFVVGRDRIHAFVITASEIQSFALVPSTSALTGRVRQFRQQLAARDLRTMDTARELYAEVLGPMRAALAGKTTLVIVPDGMLWDLPFHALQSAPGRYLIEDAAVSYAPSVTVWRETIRVRDDAHAEPTMLAFGNPGGGSDALPETATEVTQLARVYGTSGRVFLGPDAREDRWKAEAPNYRVLHLATHGVVDNASPLYSHLLLAPPKAGDREDGLLEAWEIMNLPLNADLVILSACDTARGRVAAGEGVIGLMWAVFVAGSPSTLVSEWSVDSASTTALMVAFHQEWRGGRRGVSKARALQLAAIHVLRTRGFAHPFYWAGFMLAGDGR